MCERISRSGSATCETGSLEPGTEWDTSSVSCDRTTAWLTRRWRTLTMPRRAAKVRPETMDSVPSCAERPSMLRRPELRHAAPVRGPRYRHVPRHRVPMDRQSTIDTTCSSVNSGSTCAFTSIWIRRVRCRDEFLHAVTCKGLPSSDLASIVTNLQSGACDNTLRTVMRDYMRSCQ